MTLREMFPEKQKLYSLHACESMMEKYADMGGNVLTLEEGTLGVGLVVCFGENLKTAIIKEVSVNSWTSAHTIRMYNEMPRKYADMIEKHYNAE